ncbi:MAG: hypothetical protein AAF721_40560, partial [Myxococcota bacterium]
LVLAGCGVAIGACAGASENSSREQPCVVDTDCVPMGLQCVDQVCVFPDGAGPEPEAGDDDDGGGGDNGDDDGDDDGGNADDGDDGDDGDNGDDGGDDDEPGDNGSDGDGGSDDGDTCTGQMQSCESSSECCGAELEPTDGSATCIETAGSQDATCTKWCVVDSDCGSGCCAGVADQDYGACVPADVCETFDACLDGAHLHCICEILDGGECPDGQLGTFFEGCLDGFDSEYFTCMAPYFVDSENLDVLQGACDAATPDCGPGPAASPVPAPASFDLDAVTSSPRLPVAYSPAVLRP